MLLYKIKLVNIKQIFCFLFVFFCFLGCQSHSKDVQISLENSPIFTDKEYKIQSQFFQKDSIQNLSSMTYKSTRGKIENEIYHSPKEPGKDTITLVYEPGNFQKQIVIDIVASPQMIVPLEEKNLQAQGNAGVTPVIEPAKKEADMIKPALFAEISKKILDTEEKIPFEVYLTTKDHKTALLPPEYSVKAEKGTIQENFYIAPKTACKDILSFVYKDQKVEMALEIKLNIQMEVEISKNKLNTMEEMPVIVKLYKNGILSQGVSDLKFEAQLGTFEKNVYHAPEKEGEETIQILHSPTGIEKKIQLQIVYSPNQFIETERFRIQVPSNWRKDQTEIGFKAKGPKMTEFYGAEVSVGFFPGLDFLDVQTIKMFFQQQKTSDTKELEESGEEEIVLPGNIKATKVILENFSDQTKKSWWIVAKYDGAVYMLTFTGPSPLFEGEKNIYQDMLDSFVFKPKKIQESTSLKMSSQKQNVEQDFFSMKLPDDWESKRIYSNLMIASSKVHHQNKPASLFLMSYQQTEIKNLDLSLILILFRQETVKDPTLKVLEEKDFSLPHGPAKMIAFEGGKESAQRTWIIATKSTITAYGILIFAPIEIWNANPDFAMDILNTFQPRHKK